MYEEIITLHPLCRYFPAPRFFGVGKSPRRFEISAISVHRKAPRDPVQNERNAVVAAAQNCTHTIARRVKRTIRARSRSLELHHFPSNLVSRCRGAQFGIGKSRMHDASARYSLLRATESPLPIPPLEPPFSRLLAGHCGPSPLSSPFPGESRASAIFTFFSLGRRSLRAISHLALSLATCSLALTLIPGEQREGGGLGQSAGDCFSEWTVPFAHLENYDA